MSIRTRSVRVHQIPEIITAARKQSFLRNVHKYAQGQRPRLVLDCSRVKNLDYATLSMLLSCLEEVMRGNGDVRLASLCPEAEAALLLAGVNRLFEVYPTSEAAVDSFRCRPTSATLQLPKEETARRDSEHAA